MKHWLALAILLLPVSGTGMALEPSLWRGLRVDVQAVPGKLRVNGVPITAMRFVGRDAHEIERRWLATKNPRVVHNLSIEAWRLHAVLERDWSEVLQIRTDAELPEVIWSAIPLADSVIPESDAVPLLPANCEPGRMIEGGESGGHFIQQSAICSGRAGDVLARIIASMRRHGHTAIEPSEHGVDSKTKRARFTISVLPFGMQSGSSRAIALILQRDLRGPRK